MKINQKFLGVGIAIAFWLFESFVHFFAHKEPVFEIIPHDPNELWMRIVICLLIVAFGVYGDLAIKRLLAKEKEKKESFEATLAATHHIMNNFTFKMTYFRMKMEESGQFEDEVFELFDEMIQSTTDQVSKLGGVTDITPENIEKSTYP
jgi:hypothetical protein